MSFTPPSFRGVGDGARPARASASSETRRHRVFLPAASSKPAFSNALGRKSPERLVDVVRREQRGADETSLAVLDVPHAGDPQLDAAPDSAFEGRRDISNRCREQHRSPRARSPRRAPPRTPSQPAPPRRRLGESSARPLSRSRPTRADTRARRARAFGGRSRRSGRWFAAGTSRRRAARRAWRPTAPAARRCDATRAITRPRRPSTATPARRCLGAPRPGRESSARREASRGAGGRSAPGLSARRGRTIRR
eukprot:2910-Pelagococcus_subviridis.AAC.3